MSDLSFVKVIDPRLDINARANSKYAILAGGPQQTWKSFQSQNFGNELVNFNCPPPNPNTYVNKKIYIEMKFLLTMKGASGGVGQPLLSAIGLPTAPGVPAGNGNHDAPRCLPLSQIFKTQQIQLNNDSIATNLSQYSRVYQHYGREIEEENTVLSGSPSMPDKTQQYVDLDGKALSPLNGYGDNVGQVPRGGFVGAKIITNSALGAADEATVELTVIEPLWLSPMYTGSELDNETVALIQIQDLQMTFTMGGRGTGLLSGLASALWSHSSASPSTFTSINADVKAATAYFNYITPGLGESIPRSVNYAYYDPLVYNVTQQDPVLPGEFVTMEMQTVTLKSVPNRMYIMVGRRDQDFNWESTDTFFNIDNINITFQNTDGLLANASPYDLYQMSVRNGLTNCSYDDWKARQGSILCCSFGLDVPIGNTSAPGLRGQQSLQLRVRAKNISNVNIIPTLTVFVVQEGILQIIDQHVSRSVGVLNMNDVLESKSDAMAQASFRKSKNVYGGNFFDDIGNFLKHLIRPLIDNVGPIISGLSPGAAAGVGVADQVAKSFGLGLGTARGGALLNNRQLKSLK